jgi:hypothetical protein
LYEAKYVGALGGLSGIVTLRDCSSIDWCIYQEKELFQQQIKNNVWKEGRQWRLTYEWVI